MDKVTIAIQYDSTCSNSKSLLASVNISKDDIFSYGVFNMEPPPDRLKENSYQYFNDIIPSYSTIFDGHIALNKTANSIINLANGEIAKQVSEIVGVGVSLKTSMDIFKCNRNDIVRIAPSRKMEKRLDFTLAPNGRVIEIEAKGTVIPGNVSGMIRHVHLKKVGKAAGTPRYGFVVQIRKQNEVLPSIIHVTDPPGTKTPPNKDFRFYAKYYLSYLMFILDNPQYNKVARRIKNAAKLTLLPISRSDFKYSYKIDGVKYVGNCFDDRLMIKSVERAGLDSANLNQLFRRLTLSHGKTKYFLGIDARLILAFAKGNLDFIRRYRSTESLTESGDRSVITTYSDGVLFVKSFDSRIPKMSSIFDEADVKSRLYEYRNYLNHVKHECGEPCRSREKKGKPCEIRTYRIACHFHR